ncbi:dihydropteroate synthase [Nitritalea halalkaliphila LW7]|uniref:Dihydropteroate synthase n=1 Tax=Nitritalea halalkaliphila LW7 TaxID=1189621 RepID=I5BY63_9BACT|nr:dihydropteroate synthase [Nitritalea halalkaliphila LW7]
MLTEGADILDVGGYSTRPGADEVSEQEEIERTAPLIQAILRRHPQALVSIDTFRAGVARAHWRRERTSLMMCRGGI